VGLEYSGEAFLASKEESALEQLKEAAKAEMVAAGLATGWWTKSCKQGGGRDLFRRFAMRANPDSYVGK